MIKKAGGSVAADVKVLHEYLQNVLDIEKNLYVLKKLSEELHSKLENVQLLKYPGKPQEPKAPKMVKREKGGSLRLILGVIGAAAARWMWYLDDADLPPFMAEYISVIGIFWLALCAFSAIAIITGLDTLVCNKTAKSDNRKAAIEFEKSKRDYKQKLAAWQKKVLQTKIANTRIQAQRDVLQANINAVGDQFSSSLLTLDKLYSANIIHPKYRSLSAVSSLYEYIDTGRCSRLEGADGAYNLFESEVRLDRIILKIDEVIERLDSIRQSQYQLYTVVTEGNQRTETLLESVTQEIKSVSESGAHAAGQLTDIAASEKVIAYNTERTRKELEYYNRMRYRLGDYAKVWDNKRP